MCTSLKSLAFAAALSALAGAAAHARPVGLQGLSVPTPASGEQIQSETVSYADLDLSRDAGVRTLMARLNGAARNVCGPMPDPREWASPYQACVNSAVDRALADVSRSTHTSLAMNAQRRHGG